MARSFSTKAETRDGFFVSEKRKAVWKIQLELFDELKRVCDKHHLKFFSDSGTLLGAVRHKGFIPWDDDMDFVMLREDYDKLMEIAPKEIRAPYFFQTPLTDPGFVRAHAQLRKDGTTAMLPVESTKVKFHQGIFIDIFPLDFISKDKSIEKARFDEKNRQLKLFERWYGDLFINDGFKGFTKRIARIIVPHPSLKKMHDSLENICSHVDKPSEIVTKVSFYNAFKYKSHQAEYYHEVKYLPFENREVPVPTHIKEILTTYYGKSYMTPVMGTSSHGEPIFDVNNDYKEVQKQLKNHTYQIINI